MSSMYLFRYSGVSCRDLRKVFRVTDMNMFAAVGENDAPIAMPVFCRKKVSAKSK